MSDEYDALEKARKKREKKERKSQALARRFEEGLEIDKLEPDETGKRRISLDKFIDALTYDPDGVGDIEQYTEDELDYVRKSMSRLLVGTGASVILKCPGAKDCPFSEKCPVASINKEPVGRDCLVETMLFNEMLKEAMYSLEVDPTNIVDVTYANEFAASRLLLRRADQALSKYENAQLVIDQEYETKSGDIISTKELSPHLEARDKLTRRMERITKLMVGDRQEKYKKAAALKLKDDTDTSVEQAKRAAAVIEAKFREEAEREKASDDENIVTPDDLLKAD